MRQPLGKHAERHRNGCGKNGGDGSCHSHFSAGQCAIENCQSAAATEPTRYCPQSGCPFREATAVEQREHGHQDKTASVGTGSENDRIGAFGSVSPEKIPRSPTEDRSQAVTSESELGRDRHAFRIHESSTPSFSTRRDRSLTCAVTTA